MTRTIRSKAERKADEKKALEDLAKVAPYDPIPNHPARHHRGVGRSARPVGAASLPESVTVVPERTRTFGLCRVSGCGNEITRTREARNGKFPEICASCHTWACRKLSSEHVRLLEHCHGYTMKQILGALRVPFREETKEPRTGRAAALRHGHYYAPAERRDS